MSAAIVVHLHVSAQEHMFKAICRIMCAVMLHVALVRVPTPRAACMVQHAGSADIRIFTDSAAPADIGYSQSPRVRILDIRQGTRWILDIHISSSLNILYVAPI